MVKVEDIVATLAEEMPQEHAALLKDGQKMESGFRSLESEFASIYQRVLSFEEKMKAKRPSKPAIGQ